MKLSQPTAYFVFTDTSKQVRQDKCLTFPITTGASGTEESSSPIRITNGAGTELSPLKGSPPDVFSPPHTPDALTILRKAQVCKRTVILIYIALVSYIFVLLNNWGTEIPLSPSYRSGKTLYNYCVNVFSLSAFNFILEKS